MTKLRERLNCFILAHGAIEIAGKKHNYGAPSVRSSTQHEIDAIGSVQSVDIPI